MEYGSQIYLGCVQVNKIKINIIGTNVKTIQKIQFKFKQKYKHWETCSKQVGKMSKYGSHFGCKRGRHTFIWVEIKSG